ncbi:MAG: adenylate kinase [Candidatus Marinimicrobia bacterium]|nr:adenylate kinase [Candidatus Neomarinimicrobiota bacterium]
MKLIILGPPGVGKGTQTQKLCLAFGMTHISTGDILREAIKNRTKLGEQANAFMTKGELVPDDVMLGIIDEKLFGKHAPVNYILDGFPRTIAQAEGLEKLFIVHKVQIDAILLLDADVRKIIDRLSARRTCRNCNAVYNLMTNPPKQTGRCDACGGDLFQRDDDKAETITRRLDVYTRQTKPLVDFYKKSGNLRIIPATGTPDEVFQNIKKELIGG